jgi:hypothetical protein
VRSTNNETRVERNRLQVRQHYGVIEKFLDEIGYATVYLIDTKIKENCKYNAREVKIYYPPEL